MYREIYEGICFSLQLDSLRWRRSLHRKGSCRCAEEGRCAGKGLVVAQEKIFVQEIFVAQEKVLSPRRSGRK